MTEVTSPALQVGPLPLGPLGKPLSHCRFNAKRVIIQITPPLPPLFLVSLSHSLQMLTLKQILLKDFSLFLFFLYTFSVD